MKCIICISPCLGVAESAKGGGVMNCGKSLRLDLTGIKDFDKLGRRVVNVRNVKVFSCARRRQANDNTTARDGVV